MQIRQLKSFVTVAEHLNMTRAAELLCIAQPAMSRQIKTLEEEIGEELFVRTGSGLRLTSAGNALLKQARIILTQVDWAARTTQLAAKGGSAVFRIGYISTGLYPLVVASRIAAFRRRFPGVILEFRTLRAKDQLDSLTNGSIDFAIIHDNTPCSDEYEVVRLIYEPMEFVFPADHSIASQPQFQLGDLRNEPIIMPFRDINPNFYDGMITAWRAHGLDANIQQWTDNYSTTMALVSSGLGISFSTRGLINTLPNNVIMRRAIDFHYMMGANLAWLRGARSKIHDEFICALTGKEARHGEIASWMAL